ncbi:MAG: VOC family protein [Acidimicrobiales bacterium]|jgi:catechol 2,3-dioxygenase-like lactoylglutathione lyase family enzyme|nr:VOC family protein [Acidimicrobiales bacterium]
MTADDRGDLAQLLSITVADDPAAWEAAGFAVCPHEGSLGTVHLGPTTIRLTGRTDDRNLRGIRDWTVAGLDAPAGAGSVDGIATTFADTAEPHDTANPNGANPNGATGIDHVVILTPDVDRTTAAFGELGLAVRRIRETDSYGAPMRQAFLRLGPTVVEVVGGHEGTGQSATEAPAGWFGLALDVHDLDAVAALLGEGLGTIKPAVQPRHRIATIRHKTFGMSVAVALMDRRG